MLPSRRLAAVLLVLVVQPSLARAAEESNDPYAAQPAEDVHQKVFTADRFPSAQQCRTCHPEHYREWSASQHAYAQLSPVFNAMQGRIVQLTNGSNGDFCVRCHTQVGMTLEEPVFGANAQRDPVSREGVTCIVCHRVDHAFGKISGRVSMVEGNLFVPVRGPTGNAELKRVLNDTSTYKVVTEAGQPGRPIHTDVVPFFTLTRSSFCGSCHDVNLVNGFRLEEAFSEYKSSPAAERGVTCQDCHMGLEPGRPSGYRQAPAALVGNVPTRVRKRTDHRFPGPDYSVIHAGVFPHNPDAAKLASFNEWLQFDDEAGWGADEFESHVPADVAFPPRWRDAEDRYDARALLTQQKQLLAEMADLRLALLRRGYGLGEIGIDKADQRTLRFRVPVSNLTDGHNVPTGFTAERIVFLRVTVTDNSGEVLYQSGDFDTRGDLRDGHSHDVRTGLAPLDRALLSLQSRFIVRTVHGGEREQVLAVNQSIDPLPFVRPETRATTLIGRPLDARIHKLGIEPGGTRWGRYDVPRQRLTGRLPYHIDVELVAGMVPVNLVHEVASVGFDYGLDADTVARRVVAGYLVLGKKSLDVTPDGVIRHVETASR